jgi:hypothetical protein
VGALGWLNQGTRPDISQAYSELSKFVQCPGQKHMDAAEYCVYPVKGILEQPNGKVVLIVTLPHGV